MTYRIIYHDFRAMDQTTTLTAALLSKGRRWRKFWVGLHKATEAACLLLCGAGIGLSIYVITVLLR